MVGPKHQILRKLGSLTRTVHAIVEPKFEEYGIKRGQFLYVTRIFENPGINQMTLSHMVKVDKTRAAKSIKKLIEDGFIEKKADDDDKRSHQLYVTDKGKDIYKKIIAEENRQIDVCFKGFSEEEQKLIYELMSRMTENLEEDWQNLKKS